MLVSVGVPKPSPGPADDLAWPLIQALTEAAALVQQRTEAHPEDPGTIKLLGLLAERGPLRPSDISARLGLSPAAVTRRIRTLETAGELNAVAHPNDARAYTVELTDTGQDHLEAFVTKLSARVRALLGPWSDADIVTLTTLLNRLTQEASNQQVGATPGDESTQPGVRRPANPHWWRAR